MEDKRFWELELRPDAKLTPEERDAGWHFCPDWDFGVRRFGDEGCSCDNCVEARPAEALIA